MTPLDSPIRILVADDDEDILNLVALMLEREGYDVVRARDGAEAVEVAFAARPDLLVLDVMMPKQDGFAVIRALRDETATETTPILLLTASVQEQHRERGLAGGRERVRPQAVQPEGAAARDPAAARRAGRGGRVVI